MPRWPTMIGCAAAIALSFPAHAEDGPPSRDDVMAIASDKNIKLKLDKLVSAVEASEFDWSYEDVYTLVDMEHPPEVTKPAAAKAGMFYDNPKAMSKIIADGRASASPETITVSKNEDFVVLFETFNDIKYGIEAAQKERGAIQPRQSHESDDDWFLRQRKADEVQAAKIAPLEGKIPATTFDLLLTGTVQPMGDCNKPFVTIDLNKIDFGLYRYALGGKSVDLVTSVTGKNVEKVAFQASGGRRFEVVGTCSKAAVGSPVVASVKMSRALDSNSWTGSAEFK